ncbi:MAG: DUF4255 domain-containing protein [Desulfopila sp.]
MISHALTILKNELNAHLAGSYQATTPQVDLGNLAEGFAQGTGGGLARDKLYLSVVNIKEEKTLKNVPNFSRNEATLKTVYQNPPVFLNFLLLMSAVHADYTNALLVLSRVIRYFQAKNVFTEGNVAPASLTTASPVNSLDTLTAFKLILDLYSPTMEEINHLWGTLGGKQYPFVLYMLRMLDLQFATPPREEPLVQEVVRDIQHK